MRSRLPVVTEDSSTAPTVAAAPPVAEPPRVSARERAALVAIARVVMPAGERLPAAGERAVDTLVAYLARAPRVLSGYRTLLLGLEAAARLRYGRNVGALDDAKLGKLLETWRTGDPARRTLLRLITAPLKAAHVDTPEVYAKIGIPHGVVPPPKPDFPRYVTERTTRMADLDGDEVVECDAVVVGTGAGGAVVARELAERGHAVILLEDGEYHGRDVMTGHPLEMQRVLYRSMGATVAVGNTAIPIPIGRAVGGTTIVNSGTCYRAPARIFSEWRTRFGLDVSADQMAPYYERVEEVLGVAPATAAQVGKTGEVIARGCEALGYKHGPLRRNAPGCDGQGLCCFGCPTDAKRSTNVSYVPLALKAGAQLFTGARVERILVENGRAVGVVAKGKGGRTLTVRARAVVIACGSLLTPLLLEKNKIGLESGQLGRNLSIHPAAAAVAFYDEVIDAHRAVPQGYAIEEFHDEGILFEGAFAPPVVGAASFPIIGRHLVELLERYRNLVCFGFMIEDTSRGRVRRGPGGAPLITYWLNDHDVARLKRGIEILARVYFAGGARRVMANVHGFDFFESPADLERFRRAKLSARDFDLTAYHPLGTARMGADPRTSVVGDDCQVHGTPGLYVTDGSVIPTSPAVNPQLTIMALATRAAEDIDRALN
jgi:hypothetical protein